jgi:hypothetical protein
MQKATITRQKKTAAHLLAMTLRDDAPSLVCH